MTAPTTIRPHWYTGKMQERCEKCGKVVFKDYEDAARAAKLISERTPMNPYFGFCGHWHVTRMKVKGHPPDRYNRDDGDSPEIPHDSDDAIGDSEE